MPDAFGLAAAIVKFALYLGSLTAAGTIFATILVQLDRTRGLAIGFAALGLAAATLDFSLRGANLTGDISGMIDRDMLGLLWSTPVGTAFLLRLVGIGLIVVGLFMERIGFWASVLGGLMALWSLNQVGHVSAREDVLLSAALTVHLLAVALWNRVLTPLKRLGLHSRDHRYAAQVGHRFGVVAGVTVPVLILLGVYMGYQLVGSVTALLGLAVANKLKFIPALRQGDATAARHLSNSITVEWAIILAVLAVTAVLTTNLTLPS
ncbi:copper resistance D family protein [Nereida sp. MMG025]|uniref:copper resistance D family protein n=1 Tax=Nereida sp. MMG025 TaxID=2909981 RepID=UPI001F3905E1|nr:copper-binding protein [Nereida sp. MMG025]MCF6445189.1 copper-binding protein [Nereida sp. MMG025]